MKIFAETCPQYLFLTAEDLGKRVSLPDHELTILDGVSFTIAAGEAVAIVGASGSGKSTLLSLLAGLDVPSVGLVRLDDTVLSTLDEDGRARVRGEKVGFVFQSFQLLPALTVNAMSTLADSTPARSVSRASNPSMASSRTPPLNVTGPNPWLASTNPE